MPIHRYVKQNDVQNDKYPYIYFAGSTVETSSAIYFVDNDNPNIILKTDDEGVTVSTIYTSSYDYIYGIWYDRTNGRIYFIEQDITTMTTILVKYIDISDDSLTTVLNQTAAGSDLIIGYDVFIQNNTVYIHIIYIDVTTIVPADYIIYAEIRDTSFTLLAQYQLFDDIPLDGFVSYVTVIDSVDAYVIWGYDDPANNKNCKILKWDRVAGTLTSVYTVFSSDEYDYYLQPFMSLTYDGNDILSFVLKRNSDSKNILFKYSISGNSISTVEDYDVLLMPDRMTDTSNDPPFDLEKGYDPVNRYIYQISQTRGNLWKIDDLTDRVADGTIVAVTDNYLFLKRSSNDIELWQFVDFENKFIKIDIHKIHGVTSHAILQTDEILGSGIFLQVYKGSETIASFKGFVKEKSYDGFFRTYECIGQDKEIFKTRFTDDLSSVGTKNAKNIMEYLIDTYSNFCDYNSTPDSIDPDGDFTTTYANLTFINKTLHEAFEVLMDLENGIYSIDGDGKVWAWAIANIPKEQSGGGNWVVTKSTGEIISNPLIRDVQEPINRIILYGAIVGSARLISITNDAESQALDGVNDWVDHFPHISDQTELNSLGTATLNRSGMVRPFYLDISLIDTGRRLIGKSINITFTPYTELASAADYYILGFIEDILRETTHFKLSSGLIQQEREREVDVNKTSKADEEQIDILTKSVSSAGITASGAWYLKTSGDTDDYLEFSTVSGVPRITVQGGTNLDLYSSATTVSLFLREDASNYIYMGWVSGSNGRIVSSSYIDIKTNLDWGDYIRLSTDSNVPTVTVIGTSLWQIKSDDTALVAHRYYEDSSNYGYIGWNKTNNMFDLYSTNDIYFYCDNQTTYYLRMWYSSAENTIYSNGALNIRAVGKVYLKPSNDTDDYFLFQTSANNVYFDAVGCSMFIRTGTDNIYTEHLKPRTTNTYNLGGGGNNWGTVYYHSLSDTTCADFSDYTYEELRALFVGWNKRQDGVLYHDPDNKGVYFPHIDFNTLPNELVYKFEAGEEYDQETNQMKFVSRRKAHNMPYRDDKGKIQTKTIFYEDGDNEGICFNTMVYALKELVVKQCEQIEQLENRINQLEVSR